MDNKEWLDSLKVGDKVCYWSRWHGFVIEVIEKITPTRQIKTARHTYKKGYYRGDGHNSHRIQPITQSVLDSIRTKEVREYINSYKFAKLDLDELERVAYVLESIDLARRAIDSTEPAQADKGG